MIGEGTITLDPRWSPRKSAQVGKGLAYTWLTLNRLPLPDVLHLDRESAGRMLERAWLGSHHHKKGVSTISIAVEDIDLSGRFDTPQGVLIQASGSFEDYSVIGVLCHEVGHHVDYTLNPKPYSRTKASGFSSLLDDEEGVSRNEFNVHESFAEAIRLFITNPDLLKRGRPERWEHLTVKLKLKPLHLKHWSVVLQKAPLYVHRAVRAWLEDQ